MPSHPHIVLTDYKQAKPYTPKPRLIPTAPDEPFFDQQEHGALLQNAYMAALEAAQQQYEAHGIDPAQADQGVAVEISFRQDAGIDVTKLEDARGKAHIEVLNVRLGADGKPESAILYIPPRRLEYIRGQIEAYRDPANNTKKKGKPKHYKKYDKASDFQPVTLVDFWIDATPLPDDPDQLATWDVWLREGEFAAFQEKADALGGVTLSQHSVRFPER